MLKNDDGLALPKDPASDAGGGGRQSEHLPVWAVLIPLWLFRRLLKVNWFFRYMLSLSSVQTRLKKEDLNRDMCGKCASKAAGK